MFGKLLKHELKSSAPLMLILSGIALIFGFMGKAAMKIIFNNTYIINGNDDAIWIMLPCMLLFYVAYIGIIVYFAAAQYIQLFRFYGSRFTDRGYLTFTLPVSAHCNFLSAAVNMLIWYLISYAVFIIGILLMFFGGMPTEEYFTLFSLSTESIPWGMLSAILFVASVSPVYTVAMNMTAVVTACSIFKRMKVLGCIGFLYAFQMVNSVVIAAVMLTSMIPPIIAEKDPIPGMTIGYAVIGVVMILLSVGGYFLSVHLMKKKLNLS